MNNYIIASALIGISWLTVSIADTSTALGTWYFMAMLVSGISGLILLVETFLKK